MANQVGDIVGDCISDSCGAKNAVMYRGENDDGEKEAICSVCNEIYALEDEEEEQASVPPPAPPPPPAPAPPPPPVEATVEPVVPKEIGQLKPVLSSHMDAQKAAGKLDREALNTFGEDEDSQGIASYIKKSRAWRWAHKLHKVGNPYRDGTKNYNIFSLYAEEPRTVEECVVQCAELGYNGKLSYLLTVYEVTVHCLSAGLLVYTGDSRKITKCTTKPVPTNVL